jgi:hypothetical protein
MHQHASFGKLTARCGLLVCWWGILCCWVEQTCYILTAPVQQLLKAIRQHSIHGILDGIRNKLL